MSKNIGKNINKNLVENTTKTFLIMLNSSPQIHLKLLQKEKLKKQQKRLTIGLVVKSLIKLRKSQE